MPITVAALYRFVPLPDAPVLREPLHALAAGLGLRGTLLLAAEGLNGTVAGAPEAIATFVAALVDGPLFGSRLAGLRPRFSRAAVMPFGRLKVRVKAEIVTLGDPAADPALQTGRRVAPADWNALIADPDVALIDTRNAFEVAMGSFAGARDPGLRRFGDFKRFAATALNPARDRRIALFCTGGIRCEKASAHLLRRGFGDVCQLDGGILAYLDAVPAARSAWRGGCFVFDDRVSLGHGLAPMEGDAHG